MTQPTSLLDIAPVIPVVVVQDAAHAVPIANALVEGGLPIIELTLRTPVALPAIERIAAEVPDIIVGAGTIVDAAQAKQAPPRAHSFWSPPVAPPICGQPCATPDYRTCRGWPPCPK